MYIKSNVSNIIKTNIGLYIKAKTTGPTLDPDAQTFITAAGITDSTQINAINTLVLDLKSYGIWTKMKAVYPFVGGSATSHKYNLKDPRDLDEAFRMVFNGGWTHDSNGVKANGIDGWGDTKYSTLTNGNQTTIGMYTKNPYTPIGSAFGLVDSIFVGTALALKFSGDNSCYWAVNDNQSNGKFVNNNNLLGFWSIGVSSTINTTKVIYRNQTLVSGFSPIFSITNANTMAFSARNRNGTIDSYDDSQYAFFYISDVLSSSEISDFYTAVQAYQTALGRAVGPQTVSDPDAQSFVTAADIQDPTQAEAINTLTIDLKNAGIWSKMIAIYPFVGGSPSSHKWNLKDPQDANAAFRLSFFGGWIHNSLGIKMNNSNTEAQTYITANNGNDRSISAYLTDRALGGQHVIIGAYSSGMLGIRSELTRDIFHNNAGTTGKIVIPSSVEPFVGMSRLATNDWFTQNGDNEFNSYTDNSPSVTTTLKIGNFSLTNWRGNHTLGFVHISSTLTQSEMTDLRTAVINYQTTLGRQV